MPDSWISDEMRAAVGREYGSARKSLPISLSDIRRWALAIYYPEAPPRLFWDEEYAATTSYGGVVAPEEFNPFAWITADGPNLPTNFEGAVRGSGPEGSLGIASPETNFVLNGGIEMEHGVRMRPGDVITSGLTKLVEYRERPTRLGLMLITVTETTWTNQGDEMVRISRSTGLRY
ncbi:MAG TPA: MaoC family dehydratase N-terminal domain-containing protein [Acidimicrobiales bacterium]